MNPWILALFAGYASAVAAWFAADRLFPDLWPPADLPSFSHPWREVLAALQAAAAVILLGQLWIRGIRLPSGGPAGPLAESMKQVLIFSPFLLLLAVRRHPPETALLGTRRLGSRLLAGGVIALVALAVHVVVRRELGENVLVLPRILQFGHLDEAVQILMEDIALAILLVRLASAIGEKATIAAVAALFAVAHVPAMVAGGASMPELGALFRDVLLGVLVLGTVLHSRDIAWFWPVHFVMDLTQFSRVLGVEP